MGCHAFPKNLPFWEQFIQFPEEVKEAAYKEYGDFISSYYGKKIKTK